MSRPSAHGRAERRAAWLFVAPALGADRASSSSCRSLAALLLSFTDFDIYASPTSREPALRRLGNYRAAARRRRSSGWRCATRCYFVARRRRRSRSRVSLGAALLLSTRRVARCAALFRTALLPAGRDDARRGRGGLALPLPPALRAPEPRCSARSASRRSTGSATRAGRCRAIILMAVWKNFGFNMVIFVAGLQAIPERALRGGARSTAPARWRSFRHVTLPMLGADARSSSAS